MDHKKAQSHSQWDECHPDRSGQSEHTAHRMLGIPAVGHGRQASFSQVDIFDDWLRGGTHFGWASTTEANAGAEVEIFSRRCGTPGAPALVCVHGFPTSSIDYHALVTELGAEFDIYTLDFPGYGLSGKPPHPYVY